MAQTPQGGIYPTAPGIAPVAGYAPPPQVAPGIAPQQATPPPPQGYVQPATAPPPQGYVQPATAPPPQGYVQPATAPPPQGYVQQAPPPQGYVQQAPPPQGYVQQAPPQGYVEQASAPPPQGYTAPPPQGYVQPGAPTMQSSSQGMGQAFDSMVGKVKKIALGGVSQPNTSIECFKEGNTVSLKSKISNNLRILADGRVDCRGPDGKDDIAQFVVKVVSPGVVSLQSANNLTHYLSICQGIVSGTGQGGTFCHFTLVESPDKAVSFSSVGEPGLCLGVTQDGTIADPKQVQPGHHFAQFAATVVKEGIPAVGPSSTGPAPGLPVTYAIRNGNIIQLISKMSGKPVLIAKNGIISGSGDYGELSEMLVIEKEPGVFMIRSASIKSFYLCIYNNELEGRGQGGKWCEVRAHPTPDNYVAFESIKAPNQFMGITHSGAVRRADKLTAADNEAHFRIRIVKIAPSPVLLPVLLRYDGQPSVLNSLKDGSRVLLVSRSYGDTLEIKDNGSVSTKGGSGAGSGLIVRSRGGNIVSFQHAKHPGFMLCIQGGSVKGRQGIGLQVDFVIHETYDRHILLESLGNQGQFIAVSPTGELKAPAKTNIQDPDSQFYLK